MQPSPKGVQTILPLSRHSALLTIAMVAAGFGLTLLVFYPGVWTYDARFVYQEIAKGFRGDWQSPVMVVLWSLIDPIAPGWKGQTWPKRLRVPLTTIDALIARHGMPAFLKIDVEGFEAEALAGLGQPVQALSFEFTLIQRDIARACVERCSALGYTRFNAILGESQTFEHSDWIDANAIARWLDELPPAANSGDVYARLV